MKLIASGILVLALLGGCAYPTSTVRAIDERPAIAIAGASSGTILVVDGIQMGQAREFDGDPKVLTLEPGTHNVELLRNGTVVYSEKVFLGHRGVTTVTVGAGG